MYLSDHFKNEMLLKLKRGMTNNLIGESQFLLSGATHLYKWSKSILNLTTFDNNQKRTAAQFCIFLPIFKNDDNKHKKKIPNFHSRQDCSQRLIWLQIAFLKTFKPWSQNYNHDLWSLQHDLCEYVSMCEWERVSVCVCVCDRKRESMWECPDSMKCECRCVLQ